MSGTLSITGVQTFASGDKEIKLSVPMSGVGSVTDIELALGDNTVAVPPSASGCIIVPPTTNTTTVITLKGVGGDTGIHLSKQHPSVISFDTSTPATLVLNASAAMTDVTEVTFF